MMARTGTHTILIVDDTESNVRLLAHVLKHEGYEIIASFSGEDALEMVRTKPPDLILLDVMMPDMDGFEVCRQLKQQEVYEDIPIIFLSALSETDSKVEGFRVGGVDYITKPFQREEVLARIELHVRLTKLQAELEEKVDELKHLNDDKDELMRIVGHDFRNPINGIIGLTQMLKESNHTLSAEERMELFNVIEESGLMLVDLVNGLLNKKNESNISELNLEEIDLKELIKAVVELHQPTAVRKMITIKLALVEPQFIRIDKYKIEQIISNLLSNALKFTPPKGVITIGLKYKNKEDGIIKLTVSDTGIGIPDHQLENIWTNEVQKIRSGTAGETGSGMGLNIIREFAELHDGEVRIISQEGKGTSFIVYLKNQTHKL